ncbi:hypothetical protein AYJ57_11730 [Salipiger sp. CCB-MM3]|nr:hypothetical protein AYJ57_11730 [Salipiger sp. CCB-MM3]
MLAIELGCKYEFIAGPIRISSGRWVDNDTESQVLQNMHGLFQSAGKCGRDEGLEVLSEVAVSCAYDCL